MRIEIWNVGHGACAVVSGPNGKRMMLDCGYGTDPAWFPAAEYAGQTIEQLVFLNLDEDHLDGLPALLRTADIRGMISNPTVTACNLTEIKPDGMGSGAAAAHMLLHELGPGRIGPLADLGGVEAWYYYNRYDRPFKDTNNLSLAFFVRFGRFTILFGGDLEIEGWRALLRHPKFRQDLATVTVLVASHHGRLNGQCPEVFEIAKPDIVVFSDEARRYSTQETDGWYRRRVKGIPDYGGTLNPVTRQFPKRHVLTTRRDGSISIDVDPTGNYLVRTEQSGMGDELDQLMLALFSSPHRIRG